MHYYLGIDIGTTHTKAVLVTSDGTIFFGAKKGYPLLRPQTGYEEQDASVILDAVVTVAREAIAALPAGSTLAAAGFSAAMHSILPVNKTGEPLCNALTWADTRSSDEATLLRQHPDAALVFKNTGIPFHPMSPLCKIAWFRKHRPDIFAQTAKFISIKEYIFFRLFGSYFVDHSVAAATGLFNIRENDWDAHALQMAGIGPQQLSRPVPTNHIEHALTPFYSELFGIDHLSFVAGASDGSLANLGSGAAQHGDTALTIGTSGAVRMTVQFPEASVMALPENDGLFTYPLGDDLYVRGGAINNGGIVLQWLAHLFLPAGAGEDRYDELLTIAAQAPAGSDSLLFLPYLLGERAPVWDADAKGAFIGLTMRHGRAHLVRAAIEGICFCLRQLITRLEAAHGPVEQIAASGGFTRSAFWVQLLADVTGKKIKLSEAPDASAMGAAFLAMHATGLLKSLANVKPLVPETKTFEPDQANHAIYTGLYNLFDSLYPKLKNEFATLSP